MSAIYLTGLLRAIKWKFQGIPKQTHKSIEKVKLIA